MCRPHLAGYKNVASQIMQQRKNESMTLMQQYIQHLFLERIPMAHNYHCNMVAVGPQKPAEDEGESQPVSADVK
jgi:hypothetical protein